ncbi:MULTISPECIES: hypothetical protein [Aquitalea]|uniref:Uncharacterized protein n=1 Tax=Aquitalea magnusonii TaxID=332411 RepID=A0A318JJ92_9NEIS|nr:MULTISPECIES: hypothetical protein [Aquitalea]PXX49156.1 hypothetical protein DFR38_105199 [Aquitalea magnusonii]
MYDCLQDSCSDFSFAVYDAVGRKRPLQGSLTATPLCADTTQPLQALIDFASQLGYDSQLDNRLLTIHDVGLMDALTINSRFGKELIISCDLRRETPVRF